MVVYVTIMFLIVVALFSTVLSQAPVFPQLAKGISPDDLQEIIFIRNWPFDLMKNNLIAELPYIGKEYKISFELLLTEFASAPVESVIHIGLGGNAEKYGDRAPAIWLTSDRSLHITSSISGNLNHWFNTPVKSEKNKWLNIEVSQTQANGKYIYEVSINGDIVHTIENVKPEKFTSIKVYAGDNFYNAAKGKIGNLRIVTKLG